MLASDPVQAIIDKNMTSGTKAMEYIRQLKTERNDKANDLHTITHCVDELRYCD